MIPSIHPTSLQLAGHSVSYQAIRQKDFPQDITDYEVQTLDFCREWLNGQDEFILYTSGSTGTPKAVPFHRLQLIASARMTAKALGLAAGYRALVTLPTQYIGGRMMLVRGFELGLHLTILPPSSLPLSSIADDARFDFLSFVPMQLQQTLLQTPHKVAILNRAKAILLGGAPVSTFLEDLLQPIQCPIYHTYGMTETISHIALKKLNTAGKQAYFTILEGITISTDARNCLVIQTPVLGNQSIVTNDVVRIISPSTFEWIGRIDHVINTGGVKVQAEKVEKAVEQALSRLQIQRRFFVAPRPDALLGEAVVLFIEGTPFSAAEEDMLTDSLATQLTRYEKPKAVKYIPAFCETPSGKLDKKQSVARIVL
jgi:O-succinylbenzoic acid--CoA ligase